MKHPQRWAPRRPPVGPGHAGLYRIPPDRPTSVPAPPRRSPTSMRWWKSRRATADFPPRSWPRDPSRFL